MLYVIRIPKYSTTDYQISSNKESFSEDLKTIEDDHEAFTESKIGIEEQKDVAILSRETMAARTST